MLRSLYSLPKILLILLAFVFVFTASPCELQAQDENGQQELSTQESKAKKKEEARRRTEKIQQELKQNAEPAFSPETGFGTPSLVTQAVALALMSLMPFIIMLMTSFLKIVIVLSLLRNALGVQQAPPNQIINGIALILSLFIMYPTVMKMYDVANEATVKYRVPEGILSEGSSTYIINVANEVKEPLREFLKRNSAVKHHEIFFTIARRVLPPDHRENLRPDDFIILAPSYITSQLKDAFEIGVLIYIPFFVVDLVTSNILLAMGMMMLSPVTISMPLKLFLLVMLDGWTLLIEGLVKTFRV